MVPKLLDSRLCLLLLLGLMGMEGSFHVKPSQFTWAQWFTIQHINMTHTRCDDAMRVVNGYLRRCKNRNTFLRTTFDDTAGVCGTPNITCPSNNTMKNCHQSPDQVNIVDCNLTKSSKNITNCLYAQSSAQKYYVIACANRTNQEPSKYPLIPVHLDRIF
ncbi:non-secretory ribonuclease-like [Carlito syrichta]|nr:non-secretory ribonuclease-like [Carlito syrichta]